jgi:hypothetical protein
LVFLEGPEKEMSDSVVLSVSEGKRKRERDKRKEGSYISCSYSAEKDCVRYLFKGRVAKPDWGCHESGLKKKKRRENDNN